MISEKLPSIWYGGDYNPDQWPEDVWLEDMRLMKLAHVNVATLPVFSWALLQPAEDRYDFAWLDRALDLLADHGIAACLATSTAAQPAWMSQRYPDVLLTDIEGRKHKHGGRVNFCPTSPNYRRLSVELARRLAERYGNHPALAAWHIGNEYGTHCYCDLCAEAFREWLKARYGSIEVVNDRWNNDFWSHRVYAWPEIETPTLTGERRNQPYLLDYHRFQSDQSLACYRGEYDVLKAATPDVMITTNLMSHFKPLDYQAWAPYLDIVSWDSYPQPDEPMSDIAFKHELMRGLRQGQSWMLMEQTPSQVNWMDHCYLKAPGQLRSISYQAVAHGADAVMYFQWRKARGGPEKMHGAVVDHVGHENTRVFQECAELGRELEALGSGLLDSRQQAKVAVLFDWQNWWALDYCQGLTEDLDYVAQTKKWYRALWEQNISADIVAPSDDLSSYQVVVAPVLYMVRPGVAENLKAFVQGGGTLVTTFFSGLVDENDLVTLGGYPGELRELLGIWVEEMDARPPDVRNSIVLSGPFGAVPDGATCGLLFDILHAEGAEVLATYGTDWYAGSPALTANAYGQGLAYHVASDPDPAFVGAFLREVCARAGVAPLMSAPEGVEVTQRVAEDGQSFTFVINHSRASQRMTLPDKMTNLLTGAVLVGDVELPPYGVLILS